MVKDIPELAVVVDTFEQAVQRPKHPAERPDWYSGKKRIHTIKTQVTVDENTGWLVDVSASVQGCSSDITLLRQSGLLSRLPPTSLVWAIPLIKALPNSITWALAPSSV